jgi:large subunit ribosomal protein L7/L12
VILKDVGPKKIQVIKAVRTFRADLGLKEAKELVDSAPVKVLEGVPKDQAESAANALKEQDAVAEII